MFYCGVRMVDVVFVQCDFGMVGFFVLYKVLGFGGFCRGIWIYELYINILEVKQNGEFFIDLMLIGDF